MVLVRQRDGKGKELAGEEFFCFLNLRRFLIDFFRKMSRRLTYLRATKNEEAGTNCAAWAPRAKGVTDAPFSFVLFGRGDGDEKAVALSEYNFDRDALSDTVS